MNRLFLPALRPCCVLAFSAGVIMAVAMLTVGLFAGSAEGYLMAMTVLLLIIVGLTPWLMEGLWERIRR